MIPKIIHYSWFSGEEMPAAYKQMIDTWHDVLPDYEIRLWDMEALKKADIRFANEACSVRKWAFAADAIRNYALYHYGGIWLDADIVMYKSFDPFLNCRMFIGKEHTEEYDDKGAGHFNRLTSHCMGAEKGHPFFKDCLDYYADRPFILSKCGDLPQSLKYDMRLMSSTHAILAKKYGYKGKITEAEKEEVLKEDIHVMPSFYFDVPHYHSLDDVVCVHNHLHSWEQMNENKKVFELTEKPKEKTLGGFLYEWLNKMLAKKGLQVRIKSI